MKKCPGCEKEVDKYLIACQYCGKLIQWEQEADKKAGLSAAKFSKEIQEKNSRKKR